MYCFSTDNDGKFFDMYQKTGDFCRLFSFFRLFRQKACNPGAMHLHSPLGAEFLTTEATDTLLRVDASLSLFDGYGFRRANLTAEVTTDAFLLL